MGATSTLQPTTPTKRAAAPATHVATLRGRLHGAQAQRTAAPATTPTHIRANQRRRRLGTVVPALAPNNQQKTPVIASASGGCIVEGRGSQGPGGG